LCVDCAGAVYGTSRVLACGCNDATSCIGKGIIPRIALALLLYYL
jgi:hypothetical protein